MKLGKAIEILELNIKIAGAKMPPDTLTALRLVTQVAKAVKASLPHDDSFSSANIPGETRGSEK